MDFAKLTFNGGRKMEKKFSTKEVVVVAMVAAVIGVVYTLLDFAYMPLSAVLGTVFMEITFGIYILSGALPMFFVRKPGFAIFGGLVTAGVNLLLGSPYGLQLVLAGVLQAIGVEIAYAIFKYDGSMKTTMIGCVLGAVCVFCRDMYFWGSPTCYGAGVAFGIVAVRFLSAAIVGWICIKVITAALAKTGVLKGFACTK